MKADDKLSGKRKLNALLVPFDDIKRAPEDLEYWSSPMLKSEVGIFARCLWPLDFEAHCHVEPFEAATKRILRDSPFSQLQKEVEFLLAQRIAMIDHCRSCRAIACIDAASWDEQHSTSALNNVIDGVAVEMSVARPEQEHANALKHGQAHKRVRPDQAGKYAELSATLLSGDGLTSFINTEESDIVTESVVHSASLEAKCGLEVRTTGKRRRHQRLNEDSQRSTATGGVD